MTTNGEQSAGPPKRRRRRGGRQAGQSNSRYAGDATAGRTESPELQRIIYEFVLCGRCSFFLAGCRVSYGLDALEADMRAGDGKLLSLPWDMSARRLLHESYGFDIDSTVTQFEGCCPDCGRRFVYGEQDQEAVASRLTVQLISA